MISPLILHALKASSFFGKSDVLHKEIHQEHKAEACKQSVGSASLTSVGVGLGYHFVAYDVEHGSARKGEGEGKYGRCHCYGKVADKGSHNLDKPRKGGDKKGS